MPAVITRSSSTWVGPANIAPPVTPGRPPSSPRRRECERPPQIIDERGQAELGADIVEALHQKGALVHPLLDRAEGMLDHLAPPVENFRSRFQARRHAVEHRLVFQTRDLAIVVPVVN